MRKVAPLLAALLFLMVLVSIIVWLTPWGAFEITYLLTATTGFAMSVFYLGTWPYFAISAWRKGKLKLNKIALLEFIIIPILAVPSFGLALYNLYIYGFAVNPEGTIRASRLSGLLTLWLIMLLRNMNWVGRWRNKKKSNIDDHDLMSGSAPV